MHAILQVIDVLWKTYSEMVKSNPVVGGAATLYGMGIFTYLFKDIPSRFFRYIKSQFTVSVAIHNQSELFQRMTDWLEKGNKVFRCKSFTASITYGKNATVSISIGNGNHIFFHRHRLYWLSRVEKEINNSNDRKESLFVSTVGWRPDVIRTLLLEVVPQSRRDETTIYQFNENNYWGHVVSKEMRKLDSVILTDENEKKIRDHISQYLSEREWYKKHKIPWKTAILLEGPPGTGKTTLSLAICGEFNCNLFMSNLSVATDGSLESMFRGLPAKSVMLMEDLDSYSVTNARKGSHKKFTPRSNQPATPTSHRGKAVAKAREEAAKTKAVAVEKDGDGLFLSLSGLLNAIDGVCSTEDRILIATTNHVEKLDPALIRHGRFELIIKIDYLNEETVKKMFKKFYPDFKIPSNFKIKPGISPAHFQTEVLGNKNNPQALIDMFKDGASRGNS